VEKKSENLFALILGKFWEFACCGTKRILLHLRG